MCIFNKPFCFHWQDISKIQEGAVQITVFLMMRFRTNETSVAKQFMKKEDLHCSASTQHDVILVHMAPIEPTNNCYKPAIPCET